jgi:hypothetical protein
MTTTELQERFTNACYRRIRPHMALYRAEPYLENCIPMMEPHIFYGFVEQACGEVADLVMQEAQKKYRYIGYYPGAVRQLNPEILDGDELHGQLSTCLGPVVSRLKLFTPEINEFRQALRAGSLDEIQASGGRAQQSFNAVLQGYDESMAAVVERACIWLDEYDRALHRASGF